MEYTIKNLLKASASSPKLQLKIAKAILKYSTEKDDRIAAANTIEESFDIDILQLESLINPDKFDFQYSKIEEVTI